MDSFRKIRKLNEQKAEKEFALTQIVGQTKKKEKIQKSFIVRPEQSEKTFVVRDLDKNKVHFLEDEKDDKLMKDVDQLPEIEKLLESIWQQYMTEYQKQEEMFLEACYQGHIQIIKQIVSGRNQHPIDVKNTKTDEDKNGIHLATVSGAYNNLHIIALLADCGVDLNAVTKNERRTPLMLACVLGNDDAVKSLLRLGADHTLLDYEQNTALHLACIYNHDRIVKELLDHGSSLEVKNKFNLTPVQCIKNVQILHFLTDKLEESESRNKIEKMLERIEEEKKEELKRIQEGSVIESKKKKREKHEDKIKQILISEIQEIGLSSFRKLSLLGRGAFGEVYLVQNVKDEKRYAMKVLDKSMVMRQQILRYCLTQRKILSTINHPFVVKLYFAFQTSEKLYLVMQYCPGGDILQLIKKKGPLKEETVRKYAAETVLAIEELHKAEIIYRDLKAGNIVLDQHGHACLTDFGLSKEASLSHSFCGSTAYLAPEMIWRRGHTKMLDWYLLGVFVYECLTGKPPFWDTNRQQLLSNIKSGRYKPLSKQFSPEVINFVQNLLRTNYSKRLGMKGVQDIKSHPWFKGLDWKKVQNRQLQMEPVQVRQGKPIKQQHFSEIDSGYVDNKVKGWEFERH